jgi:hypothetical protein
MPIVGSHPESGVRLLLERQPQAGPPWAYEGAVYTPTTRHGLRVRVSAAGAVELEAESGTPAELIARARLMVRSVFKHTQDDNPGQPPPRHIHRWRRSSTRGQDPPARTR